MADQLNGNFIRNNLQEPCHQRIYNNLYYLPVEEYRMYEGVHRQNKGLKNVHNLLGHMSLVHPASIQFK